MHAPYCHMWPVGLYILSHYLTNSMIFAKKNYTGHKKHFFLFIYYFCLKKFLVIRKHEIDVTKYELVFM